MNREGWINTTWGELATLEYGKSLKDYQTSFGKIPVYGTNGLIGYTDKPLCTYPSVIIGRKGAYRGVHYSAVPFFVIDTAFYLKPKNNNNLDLKYAFYELLTQDINGMDSGSAIPSTSREDFYSLELSLPPLSIQRRIASILSALDDKIELNRQANATIEAIAQAIFKEWFVDFSFPGATGEMVDVGSVGAGSEPAPTRMIPQGWRVGKLGEIITNYDSKRVPLSSRERENRKGIYPYYGAACIFDYIDDFLFDGVYLLMGEDGTVITDDEKPVLQYVTGKFWVNNHTHVLQGKGPVSTEFIYLLLKNTNIKHIVTGAVQPKINQGNMNNLPVIIPDTEPLKAFQEIIKPIFAYILEIEQQSESLTAIRDALLAKLMNGQIFVPVGAGSEPAPIKPAPTNNKTNGAKNAFTNDAPTAICGHT